MTGDRVGELTLGLAAVRARLALAAEAAGRPVDGITLLPVTKFFPAADVEILWRLGCRSFGESRDQEAAPKAAALSRLIAGSQPDSVDSVRWHMVGQVQRNKARHIARWADTVHSVSSAKVAEALNRGAAQALEEGLRSRPLRVFVQISLDGDVDRGGVDIGDRPTVDALCNHIEAAEALDLVGLMSVRPVGADPDLAFAALETEHRRVRAAHPRAVELSAGMSGDLESAVRHGSTCVRVGAALMGERPLTSP